MSGDTIYPGGIDTAYAAESDYLANYFDDIDGTGTDFSEWMRRVESATIASQTYGARVLAKRAGASIANTTSATSVLASTISVPAILRAGSILEVCHWGVVTLNSGSPTLAFAASLGGVSFPLGTSTAFTANAASHEYVMRLVFTANSIGATADIRLQGEWRVTAASANAFDVNSVSVFGGTSGTVDTTAAMTFDLTATMSVANAANTIASNVTTITHIPFVG